MCYLKVGASDMIGNQVAPFILSGFSRAKSSIKIRACSFQTVRWSAKKLVDYELDISVNWRKNTPSEIDL